MKTAVLALCLIGMAFAAPISEFVDPDCVEEDLAFEEPMADINAEFALGLPDLVRVEFNDEVTQGNNEEECEDDFDGTTEAMPAPVSSEAECEDDPIEATEAEFEPTEATEAMKELNTMPHAPASASAAECEDDPIEYDEEVTDEAEVEYFEVASTEAMPAAPASERAIEFSESAEECAEETAEPQTAEPFPFTVEGENCEGENEGAEMVPAISNFVVEAGSMDEAQFMLTGNVNEEHEAFEIEECEE